MIVGVAIFVYQDGKEDVARKGLEKNLEWAREQSGHIKSYLAQSLDGSNRYLVYSEWEKEEDFDAVRRNMMKKVMEDMESSLGGFEWMDGNPIYGNFQVLSEGNT